jgi:signal transduction histidine kinase
MIDNMNDIVWTVNPANDRFGNMLIRMKACAVEMLEAKNIAFTIEISEELDNLKIPMQIRKDYFLSFKEAVNNLAKHSSSSNASIVIDRINYALVTTITDDGKGFDRKIVYSGNGLKNMQERVHAMNGKLHIETEPGKGTCITLIVPVT